MTAGDDTGIHGVGALTVRCACGWEWAGDVEAIVAATQEHGRKAHNMASTREQVLAMARPAADASGTAAPSPTGPSEPTT